MPVTRMFTVTCDSCNTNTDDGHWYASLAIDSAKADGWHIQANKVICEECWDNGVRWKELRYV